MMISGAISKLDTIHKKICFSDLLLAFLFSNLSKLDPITRRCRPQTRGILINITPKEVFSLRPI
jgi:hypothetical protein